MSYIDLHFVSKTMYFYWSTCYFYTFWQLFDSTYLVPDVAQNGMHIKHGYFPDIVRWISDVYEYHQRNCRNVFRMRNFSPSFCDFWKKLLCLVQFFAIVQKRRHAADTFIGKSTLVTFDCRTLVARSALMRSETQRECEPSDGGPPSRSSGTIGYFIFKTGSVPTSFEIVFLEKTKTPPTLYPHMIDTY